MTTKNKKRIPKAIQKEIERQNRKNRTLRYLREIRSKRGIA